MPFGFKYMSMTPLVLSLSLTCLFSPKPIYLTSSMTSLPGFLMGIINLAWLKHKSWFLFKPAPIPVLHVLGTYIKMYPVV